MAVSLVKVNPSTEPLRPSDGVKVVGSTLGMEDGYEGYVSKSAPINGDDVIVTITKAPQRPSEVGSRLSYKRTSLILTRRNGK